MTTYHITLRDRETQTVLAVNREPPQPDGFSPYGDGRRQHLIRYPSSDA